MGLSLRKNAAEIAAKGIKEIVLTGVNIGDYGKGEFGNKKHEHTFLDLVKALDKVEGIHRFRISSIEPNLLKNETIEFVARSKSQSRQGFHGGSLQQFYLRYCFGLLRYGGI